MPYKLYDFGRPVRVRGIFKNGDTGAVLDPDVVSLSVKAPTGAITTYTYGVGGTIVKEAVGEYYAMLNPSQPGPWFYRWWSAGNGQTSKEKQFQVRTAQAVAP